MPNRNALPSTSGWLAGISFAQTNTDSTIADIPHDILHAGHASVSYQTKDGCRLDTRTAQIDQDKSRSAIVLNEQTIPVIDAATKELAPVFAKYFSDIRLVCTRDQLEISARFHPPCDAQTPQVKECDQHPIETKLPRTRDSKANAAAISRKPAYTDWRGHPMLAFGGVVIALAVTLYLGVLPHPGLNSKQPNPIDVPLRPPEWTRGLGLEPTSINDWLAIKAELNLPDSAMRSALHILGENDIYPPGHDLHDLTKYPAQVGRGLALIAASQGADDTHSHLGALKHDLEWRLIAGARFPDEASGARYSSLQRELYHNVVVLGVVELLHRRQNDNDVKVLLAAIGSGE
ncbi:MAG: hypothetical protein GTO41_17925 [Burkholderiales bacterium]|nr:hypothetical protein [Burkholderiales bacterium]